MNTCIQSKVFDMATSVRLSPETEQRLDHLATHTGRTKAYYLREIIDRGIEEMEDYYLAADVLERVRKGREKVHSAADVRKDLGLDD
ncbi:RelB protein (plasmid) [Mycetohabitans rhizoxinica HKI 454]|uniref:RelB protein n=2 Tax=Burkholderiaceae TaxID=119060 RepID=E5AVV8_MYCRK|nr:RelB protein [Mycetohabitans rhizoxinica HKI 454]